VVTLNIAKTVLIISTAVLAKHPEFHGKYTVIEALKITAIRITSYLMKLITEA